MQLDKTWSGSAQPNILNLEQLKQVVGHPESIIHLAAKTSLEGSLISPYDTYYTNILGTLNLLELARIKDIRKFIYVSTYVYGKPEYLPVDEEHHINPHSPYNKSKLIGEDLCRNYCFDYGIDVVALRPFSLYGPNGRAESFISSVINQISTKGKAILTAKNMKRDFLFIYDFVDLVSRIIGNFPNAYNTYNVGSGASYALEDVCLLISRFLHKSLVLGYKNSNKGVIYEIVADISKLQNSFRWRPSTTLEEGIKLTINTNTT